MPDHTGYTDRPWAAGRGALIVMYLFGVPAGLMLSFLAVASVPLGGPAALFHKTVLRVVFFAMVICALAALVGLVVAIIRSYVADTTPAATGARAARPVRRESTAAQPAPADPWLDAELAPTDGYLTADELAPVAL
jgi:hypothetical protein